MEREQAMPSGDSEDESAREISLEQQLAKGSSANERIVPSCSLSLRASRRTVLRALGAAALLNVGEALALSLGTAGCATHPSTPDSGKGISRAATPTPGADSPGDVGAGGPSSIIGNTRQMPLNSATPFDAIADNGPGVLIHLPSGLFVAYDAVCTHEGCTVAYNARSQHLECPCHGSIFDPANAGQVVGGPARQPLAAIKITIDKSTGVITQ
jgi:nitrite reductase/ring-hydroxylating ferredoxin subunit